MSDAKTEALTKLNEILAGQTRLQEAFDKVIAALVKPRAVAASTGSTSNGGTPTLFPNYGRSKGSPIAGASKQDLDFYRNGAMRSLSDPEKSRFHAKEQALVDAIDAELNGGGPPPADDAPPPAADDVPF